MKKLRNTIITHKLIKTKLNCNCM